MKDDVAGCRKLIDDWCKAYPSIQQHILRQAARARRYESGARDNIAMHTCPVCGYDKLEDPPENFNICPCCGTEFGLDDAEISHAELRATWLRAGAKWWSPYDKPMKNWDAWRQVEKVI